MISLYRGSNSRIMARERDVRATHSAHTDQAGCTRISQREVQTHFLLMRLCC